MFGENDYVGVVPTNLWPKMNVLPASASDILCVLGSKELHLLLFFMKIFQSPCGFC